MKTANSFREDSGDLEFTISAQNVTDHTEFTTAEDIPIAGVLTKATPKFPDAKTFRTPVAGDQNPIVSISGKNEDAFMVDVEIVDDWFSGGTGEFGTDTLQASKIAHTFWKSRKSIGGIKLHPDGQTAGTMAILLSGNVFIKSFTPPGVDAKASDVAMTKFSIEASDGTIAVNA